MSDHECYIGEIQDWDDTHVVTLNDLKHHIEMETKCYRDRNEQAKKCGMAALDKEIISLEQYADTSRETDLFRFTFCPVCGKRIDWDAIKKDGKSAEVIEAWSERTDGWVNVADRLPEESAHVIAYEEIEGHYISATYHDGVFYDDKFSDSIEGVTKWRLL